MSLRWGLLSTARINEQLIAAGPGRFVAVGSRSLARAQAYAQIHHIPHAHGSYEALLADDDVDVIYVSLPNGLHVEWTLRALAAGKHVLCEKPLAARADEVVRCFDAAEAAGLVLSEGFMWRHHPQANRLLELLADGTVGRPLLIRAAFAFALSAEDDVRWDPALGGGALLDVGCYCVSAARLIAGEPERVAGEAVLASGAVDLRFAGLLRFPGDLVASFDCGLEGPARAELEVIGSEGSLCLYDPWHGRDPVIGLARRGEPTQRVEVERENSYLRELEDIEASVLDHRPPLLGRADALGQARTLEALRASASRRATVAVAAT